ncbi:MAG: hypothetical protein R3B06_10620 [Kofleriaceae bacterium]
MSNFTTIDPAALVAVAGGNDTPPAPNQARGSFNVGYDDGKRKIGVQGEASKSVTDYKACADGVLKMPDARPADIRATCGLPPGAQP